MLKHSNSPMNKWLTLPLAFGLSFLMIGLSSSAGLGFAAKQWDFIALWLLSFVVLSLPMIYLEIGLAKRGKASVMQALTSLTRDADAKPVWRLLGWFGVFFIAFVAGALLSQNTKHILSYVDYAGYQQVFIGGLIVSLGLSFLPRAVLIILTLIGLLTIAILNGQTVNALGGWAWTATTAQEWATTVALVIFATGFGMSLYWQNLVGSLQQQQSVTPMAILIAGALILAGLVSVLMPIDFSLVNIVLVALLLQSVRQQLLDRQISWIIAILLPCLVALTWLGAETISDILLPLLISLGLVLSLIYSIFAGWAMKASHLRKVLNFSNEFFYNLWRVAVRIVIPVAICVALVVVWL